MAPKMPSNYHSFKSSNLDLRTPTSEEAAATDTADSRLKCVLVGDGAVGKTSLIVSYSTNGYPTEYVPTAYDNYSVRLKVDEQPIKLQICDTAGQDEFDEMRPLCYPGCDVILVCFSVVRPTSLSNVLAKWLPEMKKHLPKVPLVLVGTQSDLRTSVDVLVDLARYNERPVTEAEARQVAEEHGACCYVECSSLTQKHLKEVFDAAVVAALEFRVRNARKRKRSWRRRNEAWCPVKREQAQWRALAVRRKSGVWWRKLFCF